MKIIVLYIKNNKYIYTKHIESTHVLGNFFLAWVNRGHIMLV